MFPAPRCRGRRRSGRRARRRGSRVTPGGHSLRRRAPPRARRDRALRVSKTRRPTFYRRSIAQSNRSRGDTDEKSGQPPPSGGGTHFCGVCRTGGGIAVERRGRRRRPTRLRRAADGDPHGRPGRQPAPRRLSPTPADHADPAEEGDVHGQARVLHASARERDRRTRHGAAERTRRSGRTGSQQLLRGRRPGLHRPRRHVHGELGAAGHERRSRPEATTSRSSTSASRSSTRPGTCSTGRCTTNTLWSGFGGGCQTNNDGDATVVYDRLADRWIISSSRSTTVPYLRVRRGLDDGRSDRRVLPLLVPVPELPGLPEARRLAGRVLRHLQHVRPNGIAFRARRSARSTARRCSPAAPATQQCFTLATAVRRPAARRTSTARRRRPPVARTTCSTSATNALDFWKFHVDWATPANSTLHRADARSRSPPFTPACSGGTCIPQPARHSSSTRSPTG